MILPLEESDGLCLCGCGQPLTGKQKKYASNTCESRQYQRHRRTKEKAKQEEAVKSKLEFCLCGCGQRLKGKQKKFASKACNSRHWHQKDKKRSLEFCLCGCGQPLMGKQAYFSSNACLKHYKRQEEGRSPLELCLCGCGQSLEGNRKRFATDNCRARWRREHIIYPDKYKKKQEVIEALALAVLVFDFQLSNGGLEELEEDCRQGKRVLSEFYGELKAHPGVALLAPKPDGRPKPARQASDGQDRLNYFSSKPDTKLL